MAKITWEISQEGYGVQCEIVANTRAGAIATAEAQWLADTAWMRECVGNLSDDGTVFARPPIPEFIARKAINFQRA